MYVIQQIKKPPQKSVEGSGVTHVSLFATLKEKWTALDHSRGTEVFDDCSGDMKTHNYSCYFQG
jgi:hypothetical protein